MAKYIFSTDIIPQKLRFLAEEYHRHHHDTHVQSVTLYRVSERNDGSGGIEWLLTRFRSAFGNAESAILLVEIGGNGEEYMHEFFCCLRKGEKAMIEEWKRFVEEEDDG